MPYSSVEEKAEYRKAIDELVQKGAVSKCRPSRNQYLSPYFLVSKPNGEKRFVLNLKKLNMHIKCFHFKMEDSRTVSRLIDTNFYMCTIDLKDAYYSVPVARSHRKFLRFVFDNKTYEFNCLPFGLASAPYVFTKLLKPVAHFLRSRGFLSVIYLDDIILMGESEKICAQNARVTCELLESLGFQLNLKKCNLKPSQHVNF